MVVGALGSTFNETEEMYRRTGSYRHSITAENRTARVS